MNSLCRKDRKVSFDLKIWLSSLTTGKFYDIERIPLGYVVIDDRGVEVDLSNTEFKIFFYTKEELRELNINNIVNERS